MPGGRKLILWTGPKHSGKTAAAGELVERLRARGFSVAGLLAPSVYQGGQLVGFDALDLSTGQEARLLRRAERADAAEVGSFVFDQAGRGLARAALSCEAARRADLVVVDEFGPLELGGGGWRGPVDALIAEAAGVILLVVRAELVDEVRHAYGGVDCAVVAAAGPRAAEEVLSILSPEAGEG